MLTYTRHLFEGRVGRKRWFLGIVFLGLLGFVVGFIGPLTSGVRGVSVIGIVVVILLSIVLTVHIYALHVRRLHDFGKSGKLAFLFLIPFVSLVMFFYLLKRSDPAANTYGAPADTTKKFLRDIFNAA